MKDLFTIEATREQFECTQQVNILSTKIPVIDEKVSIYKKCISGLVVFIMVFCIVTLYNIIDYNYTSFIDSYSKNK